MFRLGPKLIGLRKQSSGIERHYLDLEGLLKYRMRDRLILNTKARSEYDSATHQVADCYNTLHQLAIEACR